MEKYVCNKQMDSGLFLLEYGYMPKEKTSDSTEYRTGFTMIKDLHSSH